MLVLSLTSSKTPRLSGLLRAHFRPEHEREFDAEQAFLRRSATLKQVADKAARDPQRSDEKQLTWQGHFALSGTKLSSLEKETEKLFHKFLLLIPKVVGDELSTRDLHVIALFIFEQLSRADKSTEWKREKLRSMFGSGELQAFGEAIHLASTLYQWREEHRLSAEESSKGEDATHEYGAQIPFTFDSNFLLRMFIEPGVGLEQTAPEEWQDQQLSGWEGAEDEEVTLDWLPNQCERHIQISGAAFSVAELSASILRVLSARSSKSDAQLQNQLYDLLGETGFEFIRLLIDKRTEILRCYASSQGEPAHAQAQIGANGTAPAPGLQFSITSEEEKHLLKLQRKDNRKRARRAQASGANSIRKSQEEWLSEVGWNTQVLRQQREEELQQGPGDLEDLLPQGTTTDFSGVGGRKILLPQGTVRRDKHRYEEVQVPYVKPEPFGTDEALVAISEFDPWARVAFEGVTKLNRIQSRVFQAAYRSNENLLICAPTGAGKTNVAMMTILHEVGQHFLGGYLQRDKFKIVYIAPMKALAQEMVRNFGNRLQKLGILVKELTGDVQLTRREITETQMIVTTPEKWDVITRKTSDMALAQMVRLLIIDEVHLLHEDRGPVIETLVARTLRQVESTQSMIRIVGLSATLPNYEDVAVFLRVNPKTGLFHFNNAYRPVPLTQQYIGVKETDAVARKTLVNKIAYTKAKQTVMQGQQAMVFVHSRKGTVKTAQLLGEIAQTKGTITFFMPDTSDPQYMTALKEVSKSRNRELKELFPLGLGIHHAGMLRADRSLVERLFSQGYIKVLCCTSTLAWGVNLPAHTVIIAGTELYDSKQGAFVELGMLDVMQIFGRAGRPQYDTSGEGIIITSHQQLPRYLSLMNHQLPIESQFIASLADHLNAEISSGTVTNLNEAVEWMSYTYLYVRMLRNPLAYGITHQQKLMDPQLAQHRRQLVITAAKTLDECRMIRFNQQSGTLDATHLGRTASHFYLLHDTIRLFNEHLRANMSDAELLALVCQSSEFEQMKIREEEHTELKGLLTDACEIEVKGGVDNPYGKVNILFQAYLSGSPIDAFALVSDQNYVTQNISRIFRGLFDIVLQKAWTGLAERILAFCKMCDLRMWDSQHPLQQFGVLHRELLYKLITKRVTLTKLYDMDHKEIGQLVGHPRMGGPIAKLVRQFPALEIEASAQPITRTVLRVTLLLSAAFEWNDRIHGSAEGWWVWIEDPENEHIYHHEYFLFEKKMVDEPQKLSFTIPIFEPLPSQYLVRAVSNRWLHADTTVELSFKHLILPEQYPPHTNLLDLMPLPVTALHNEAYQKLYPFSHFNPIQTQVFHTTYHTDVNVLLGAPTGSGKTVAAELAMLRVFNETPHLKVVYIAPLKALVRERMKDWKRRFVKMLDKRMVELTGDFTPDVHTLQTADIVTTTPEKWDGISRNWQQRSYVKAVGLIIIDEVHLLGADRGPILEVIVSRMRYISSQTENPVRLVCLSTAVANARDLADWLGIEGVEGLFNFRPSVRPVPLEVHIQGFPGEHYCPRMAAMNKPTYAAIKAHSPLKPALVFVSSRRQTRLTALDLIAFCVTEENPRQFLHMAQEELQPLLDKIRDVNLRHTLSFGIGLHHAGLPREDKALVEELFATNRVQILISTATLAWGVNLPAHLVVIKGTEFFDAKTRRYLDFPITDVLQMMGRAGRPQFDQLGKAVIMVHEPKKNFYKKFLYEPFPVESSLPGVLHDHFNAEIVAGTITAKQDAVDYLTWTYFFRRLVVNPSYYGLEDTDFTSINRNLSERVDVTIRELEESHCLEVDEDGSTIYPLTFGRIASFYYLRHTTMRLFYDAISETNDAPSLLAVLSNTSEYDELPVRHNEDKLNEELAAHVPIPVDAHMLDDPHTKAHLLLQAHLSSLALPISDYVTDTNSVLDQAIRILQAMVDVAADGGWLFTTLNCMHLMQMIMQGQWHTDSTLLTLPYFTPELVAAFAARGVECLPELQAFGEQRIRATLKTQLREHQIKEVLRVLGGFPLVDIKASLPENIASDEEEVSVKVELILRNAEQPKYAHTPRFPKTKEASWWLVLGDAACGELLALRRLSVRGKCKTTLTFTPPEEAGRYTYFLYLMSDAYLGIDQQLPLTFHRLPILDQ